MLQINEPVNTLMDFRKDTVLIYTVADSNIIERMTYTFDDTSFTLVKIDGQSDCYKRAGKIPLCNNRRQFITEIISR